MESETRSFPGMQAGRRQDDGRRGQWKTFRWAQLVTRSTACASSMMRMIVADAINAIASVQSSSR